MKHLSFVLAVIGTFKFRPIHDFDSILTKFWIYHTICLISDGHPDHLITNKIGRPSPLFLFSSFVWIHSMIWLETFLICLYPKTYLRVFQKTSPILNSIFRIAENYYWNFYWNLIVNKKVKPPVNHDDSGLNIYNHGTTNQT